ncbi:hypothetical protein ACFFU9_13565 [Mariniflexile ostreae]|uniref:DUF3052 family protein n=1 Tax=Mariniflexile ostreae TaxID=1520892 RepID=A0ABV5FEB3_9FLAO
MIHLSKRLKLKDQDQILILNRPDDFSNNLEHFEANVVESLVKTSTVSFALLFVTSKQQLIDQMPALFPKLKDDCLLWVAFPNKTSKSNIVELYNDKVWEDLMEYRLLPKRRINLNDQWDALRFKKIEYIKKKA